MTWQRCLLDITLQIGQSLLGNISENDMTIILVIATLCGVAVILEDVAEQYKSKRKHK